MRNSDDGKHKIRLAHVEGALEGAEKSGTTSILHFEDERKHDLIAYNKELKCAGRSCNDRGSVTGDILTCTACKEEFHIECQHFNVGQYQLPPSHPLNFGLLEDTVRRSPNTGGTKHPICLLAGSVASYRCHFMLT